MPADPPRCRALLWRERRSICYRLLCQSLDQAHRLHLPAPRRAAGSEGRGVTALVCSFCRANLMIAWLTGWAGLSSTIGVPLLIDTGTSRLDGTCRAIGLRTTLATSSAVRPTFASERLRTTDRISPG